MKNLGRRFWPAAAVLLLALVALGPAHRAIGRVLHPIHVLQTGDRFVPIRLDSTNGDSLTIPAADGHPRLINVFATWCTECIAEMPDLSAAAPKLRKAGVEVIGIDQDESAAKVQAFADRYGLTYPLYIDGSGVSHQTLGARYIPTTILVGANGRILAERIGPLSKADFYALARIH